MNPTDQITRKLDEISARREAATPGPWFYDGFGKMVTTEPIIVGNIICDAPDGFDESMSRWPNNANFIAHSRGDVERLEKALRVAVTALSDIRNVDWQKSATNGSAFCMHGKSVKALAEIARELEASK